MDVDTLTEEKVVYSCRLMEKAAVGTGLIVSGFASMRTLDRDGDIIDPLKFDLDTYMKNPQLLLNHQLWRTKNGNGIAIGVAQSVIPVKAVVEDPNGDVFTLEHLKTGERLRTVNKGNFLVRDGEKGLWIEAKVIVKEVADMVLDGRLNAFSWQGIIYRRGTGAIAKIDLLECSLVNIPANARALFQIGKTLKFLRTIDSDGLVEIPSHSNFARVSAVMEKFLGLAEKVHAEELGGDLTDVERELLSAGTGLLSTTDNKQEGGDLEMDEKVISDIVKRLEAFGESMKVIDTIAGSLKGLTEKVSTMEAALEASAEGGADGDADATKAKADADAKKAADEKVAADALVAAAKAKEDETTAAADAKKVADDATFSKVASAIQAMSDKLDGLPQIEKAVDTLTTRVAGLERKPADSKQVNEDGEGDEDLVMAERVKSALKALEPEERVKIETAALAGALVPVGLGKG